MLAVFCVLTMLLSAFPLFGSATHRPNYSGGPYGAAWPYNERYYGLNAWMYISSLDYVLGKTYAPGTSTHLPITEEDTLNTMVSKFVAFTGCVVYVHYDPRLPIQRGPDDYLVAMRITKKGAGIAPAYQLWMQTQDGRWCRKLEGCEPELFGYDVGPGSTSVWGDDYESGFMIMTLRVPNQFYEVPTYKTLDYQSREITYPDAQSIRVVYRGLEFENGDTPYTVVPKVNASSGSPSVSITNSGSDYTIDVTNLEESYVTVSIDATSPDERKTFTFTTPLLTIGNPALQLIRSESLHNEGVVNGMRRMYGERLSFNNMTEPGKVLFTLTKDGNELATYNGNKSSNEWGFQFPDDILEPDTLYSVNMKVYVNAEDETPFASYTGIKTFNSSFSTLIEADSVTTSSVDHYTSTFDILITNPHRGDGELPTSVRIPVWTLDHGAVWYTAQRIDGTNNWTARVDKANHEGDTGLYQFDLHLYNGSNYLGTGDIHGPDTFIGVGEDVKGELLYDSITYSSLDQFRSTCVITLKNVMYDYGRGANRVFATVWTQNTAAKFLDFTQIPGTNDWQLTVEKSQFYNNTGSYSADLFCANQVGNEVLVRKGLSFEIGGAQEVLYDSMSLSSADRFQDSFTVSVTNVRYPDGHRAETVRGPAWFGETGAAQWFEGVNTPGANRR